MPKPIDDTDMLDNMAEAILDGEAHTPTGAMRLYAVEDGSADERRLLRKWKDGQGVKAMERMAHLMLAEAVKRHREELSQHGFREYERGYRTGVQSERDAREAAMIAGTSALAQPAQVGGTMTPGMFYEAPARAEPVSWWERVTSRRAKVWE